MNTIIRSVLLAGVAMTAIASQAHADAADAAKITAECVAAEANAKAVCDKIAADVAAGKDPIATLPVVDDLAAGDVVVSGPWGGVAVRKTVKGYSALAVTALKANPAVSITKVTDAAQAASLTSAPAAAAKKIAPATLAADVEKVAKDAKAAAEKLAAELTAGKDPFVAMPTIDAIVDGDVLIGGLDAPTVIRKTARGYAPLAYTGTDAIPFGVSLKGAAASAAKPAEPKPDPKYAAGWVVDAGMPGSLDGTQPIRDRFARWAHKDTSSLDLHKVYSMMPVAQSWFLPQYTLRGMFDAKQAGAYRFAVEVITSGQQIVGHQCWPSIAAIDNGTPVPLTNVQPVQSIAGKRGMVETVAMDRPVEIAAAGLQEMQISIVCNPLNTTEIEQSPEIVAQFFGPAVNRDKNKVALLPDVKLKVQRPGENGFSELKPDEVVFDIGQYPGLSVAGASTAGAITLGGRKSVAEALPNLDLKDTKPGWFIDVYARDAASEQDIDMTFPSGANSKFTLGDHFRFGGKTWGKSYLANSRLVAPKAGDYTIAVVAANQAYATTRDYMTGDKCSVSVYVSDGSGTEHPVVATAERAIYTGGQQDLRPVGITAPVWSGTFTASQPGVYALRAAAKCDKALEDGRITKESEIAYKMAAVSFQVLLRGPDDATLRIPGDNDFRYRSK